MHIVIYTTYLIIRPFIHLTPSPDCSWTRGHRGQLGPIPSVIGRIIQRFLLQRFSLVIITNDTILFPTCKKK